MWESHCSFISLEGVSPVAAFRKPITGKRMLKAQRNFYAWTDREVSGFLWPQKLLRAISGIFQPMLKIERRIGNDYEGMGGVEAPETL